MKKSLLLAAMLLSSAAQAETWVCSEVSSSGKSFLLTFVRQDAEFSLTVTTPKTQEEKSRTIESEPYEILVETDAMLTLAKIQPDGKRVSTFMINKITNQFVSNATIFDDEIPRSAGSCVRI
jgi:hypothetical protein|tara:strand:+ start:837 stop:1202 length:366 start_codon:yes stop_codon:yes gene_type:complete